MRLRRLIAVLVVAAAFAAWSAVRPKLPPAERGRRLAERAGCFGCHGPGGRLAHPNPGSFKGYIPSWDGDDFGELVGGEREFGEWVRHGVSDRFRANPAASFFLKRANLHMQAYDKRLQPGDL